MTAQTTYSRYQGLPPAGTIADPGFARVESWTNGQGTDLPAGIAVTKLTGTEASFDLGTTNSDPVVGIIVNSYGRDPGYSGSSLSSTNAVKSGATCDLMVEGPIAVIFEQTMTPDDLVFVRYASGGGGTQLGAFRKDADTATARRLKGARVIAGAVAGAVGIIYFSAQAEAASF